MYGNYTGSTWEQDDSVADGSVTDPQTGITLSKTAAPTADPNVYDITLTVQTSPTTTTVDPTAAAMVLVIDLSNSMTEKVGDMTHLEAAKNAAKAFLAEYADTSATANRLLTVVGFGTSAKTMFAWANVAGGAGENSYDAAAAAIDNLPDDWFYEAVQEATNSHEYTRLEECVSDQDFNYEDWTAILPVPDWAALEKVWSTANSK